MIFILIIYDPSVKIFEAVDVVGPDANNTSFMNHSYFVIVAPEPGFEAEASKVTVSPLCGDEGELIKLGDGEDPGAGVAAVLTVSVFTAGSVPPDELVTNNLMMYCPAANFLVALIPVANKTLSLNHSYFVIVVPTPVPGLEAEASKVTVSWSVGVVGVFTKLADGLGIVGVGVGVGVAPIVNDF